ncbi:MAG: radical SAM protein [Myxococcales bacterium]|nr:radical SAM protein [Myxococcales bacterium]
MSVARDFIDYPYFSDLGALQLASVLRARGDIALVDAFALPSSGLRWRADGRAHLGATLEDVRSSIRDAIEDARGGPIDAVVVAYTPFHRPPHRDDLLASVLMGLRARLPRAPLLLADCYQSGQHYVDAPGEAVLASYPEVDAWIKFEAERTVPELIAAFRDRCERPRGVYRGARPPQLDELPLPAWALIDRSRHAGFLESVVRDLGRGPWAFPIDGRTLPLVTSRGCPFTCVHCSSNPDTPPGEPKTQRRYSAPRLREYLRELAALGATRLAVLDELINVNERHFDAFLETAAGELDLQFEIPNGMRADYLEERHLEAMKGRVTTLSVSAESGAQRVVTEVVRKRLDLRAIERAAERAHKVGVPLLIHYMIGLPGETAEEINQTLEFSLDLWDRFKAFPAVQYATPLPGTALGRSADERATQAGARLPVVDDWGPRFQKAASHTSEVPREQLERFMWTFQERLRASQGARKLIINVTYVCNNHCTFCAVGTRTQLDGHPTRQREHLLKYREQGVHMVDFDGGEPTLNPELIPLIRYARGLGYDRVNVTTNGRRCYYEKYARALVHSGLTTLLFSVHGPNAKIHAQQVGVAEAFEQTVGGIENCVRLKPPHLELGMNITVTKGNHTRIEEMTQLAWDLGLRWINVQFLTPFGRATSWVAPDTQAAADRTMAVMDRWQDRMKFQIINLPFCFMPGYERFMQGDLAKLERHMVFVNNETVNLAEYLAERRTRRPVCKTCPHACFCGGFYELDDVPEPPWLISADDLVRPIDDPRRHESVPAGFRQNIARKLAPK